MNEETQYYENLNSKVRLGTRKYLQAWVDRYPELFTSKSHIVRAALEMFYREQKKMGRYAYDDLIEGR